MISQYVVYDVETYSKTDSTSIEDTKFLAVAVTKSSTNGEIRLWFEEEVPRLIQYLLSFPKIVGFNIKSFDNGVLASYLDGALERLNAKSIDLMELVEQKLGHRMSLASISGPTLRRGKVLDGALAAKLWKEGNEEQVISYCKDDVEITYDLFNRVLDEKPLLYEAMGQVRSLLLSLDQQADPRDFNYKVVDNGVEIIIDKENKEFFRALQLAMTTDTNIYLTGKAGTGKTTFLKYLKSNMRKNTAIVAFTGVAAINAGGQTIHSFFKINFSEPPFVPNDKRLRLRAEKYDIDRTTIFSHFQYNKARLDIFKNLEVLIIDEISMLRADVLDVIDRLLQAFGKRGGRGKPFGGVQVILIGDVFQLPPIPGKEWPFLARYYKSPFFFDAQVFKQSYLAHIELKKIYRQKEPRFIELLNSVRLNKVTAADLTHLNSQIRPVTPALFDQNYIALCSTNEPAGKINKMMLDRLTNPPHNFKAEVTGTFPAKDYPTDYNLCLKEGAQIMFLKNSKNYYNGKVGKIKSINHNMLIATTVNSAREEIEFEVEPYTWHNVTFTVNKSGQIEKQTIGSFTQYPLKLAWAITVHKSQGMTFEKVIININDFTPPGLVYVALSRCTSFGNLIIRHPIKPAQIKTHPRAVEFATSETPETTIQEKLTDGLADSAYKTARMAFKNGDVKNAIESFFDAVNLRSEDLRGAVFQKWIRCHARKILKHRDFFQDRIERKKPLEGSIRMFLSLTLQDVSDVAHEETKHSGVKSEKSSVVVPGP